ncbi:hypothetical protein LCGC14_1814650 [marine sediment metagenome]|uniref:Uncharacterized protein n=1 Tax=marine sediment metagenome TaxID=412755 RepID=A0A0F9GKK8_9ZZZZ
MRRLADEIATSKVPRYLRVERMGGAPPTDGQPYIFESATGKWIPGVPGDTVVHGISRHTEFNTWKVFYTDASGDEQEIAVGADGTVFTSTGASSAPAFETGAGHAHAILQDADADTKIQVEESADEDIIRFDAEGTEMMTLGKMAGIVLGTADLSGEYGVNVGALSLLGGSKTTHYGVGGKISLQGGQGRDAANDPVGYAPVLLQPNAGRVGIGTIDPATNLEVVGPNPGSVGGFQSGMFHVRGSGDAEFSNSVITGHNSYGGNKQLWYLGSVSSSNDDIAFINRQNGSFSIWVDNVEVIRVDPSGLAAFAGDVTIALNKSLATDTITEKTAAAGVTIDSVLLKDGLVDGVDVAARDHAKYTNAEAVTQAKTVKLDDFTAPDDTVDLDVSITKHGLAPKAPNDALKYLNGVGLYSVPAGGGGGAMATDVLWDAAGDLAVGTGADAAVKLPISAPAATFLNVLGLLNGETTPTYQALFDATNPVTQAHSDAAATGSATKAARRDHKHGMPAGGGGGTKEIFVPYVNGSGTPEEEDNFPTIQLTSTQRGRLIFYMPADFVSLNSIL